MEEYKYTEWVGSSKNDLKKFPAYVQDQVGFALYQAQLGLKHRNVKSLRNIGSNVLEIASRYDGNTYRVVYTVQFRRVVYVLHAFRKKAKRGISTPKQDIDLIKRRLKAANQHYKITYSEE
ncbi:MAG: type II toxin-antitoxin system RelE/ParE family toxin [Gammaproteobacteria bacterium]|nr:type II toxin-antitoxin system RelE/ParE family toxin [Gammaproteobacteria bacterium]